MSKHYRRNFLRGASGLGLSLPFLPSLLNTAQGATAPRGGLKRIICLSTGYGTVGEQWFPSEESRTSTRRISERAVEMAFSDFAGDISTVFDRASFGPYLDQMLMLDGIDGTYRSGHWKSKGFTGSGGETVPVLNPSIDQLILEHSSLYQSPPAFRSLHIANGGGSHSGESISWARSGSGFSPVPEIAHPELVWDQALSRIVSADDGEAQRELARLIALKGSVVDHVHDQVDALVSNPQSSTTDRLRLEAYLSHVRDFESSLSTTTPATCDAIARPDDTLYRHNQNSGQRGIDHMTNIVHILRCGLTGVLTFSLTPRAQPYPDMGLDTNLHEISHNRDGSGSGLARAFAEQLKADQYHMELLLQLLRGLDVVEDVETGRTFLDNSLIVYTSDMGGMFNHFGHRLPLLLFGGKGAIKRGRMIDFRTEHTDTIEGRTHARTGIRYNSFLMTLCHLFGLTPEDWEDGSPGLGSYSAANYLYRNFPGGEEGYSEFAFGDRRSPISEILEA